MKKSCIILVKKGRQLGSLQMDRNSPRGATRSLVNLPSFLHGHQHHHSSPSALHYVCVRHSSLSLNPPFQITTQLFVSPLHSHNALMEKNSHDNSKGMKDQVREGLVSEVCDNKSSKFVSDYILPHILNLYASRATPKDFEIYAPDATFEDPLMCARGVKQIKSAFYSLAKVFSESRIVDYSITENETSPGKTEILIDNKQYYKFLGKGIDMISLIKLYTEDGKVVRHEDRWDKKPLWNRETVKTPLVGHIIDATKRASMLATHALMRFGKDPST